MILKKINSVIIAVLFIGLFVLSYLRESYFRVINGIISNRKSNINIAPPEFLKNNFTPEQLINLKWILTIFFCFCFWGIGVLILKKLFPGKNFFKKFSIIYISFFVLAVCLALSGKIVGQWEEFYSISRSLIGILHSPVLILGAVGIFYFAQFHHK